MDGSMAAALVLVVDDEPSLRELHQSLLERAGFRVIVARDGSEALAMIESRQPDAMVLDLSMPGLDGMGVLRAIADQPHRPRTLVVTARHDASDIEQAIALGASDYLAKPFDPAQLLSRVARLTRRRAR